jgi:hypothetical protein
VDFKKKNERTLLTLAIGYPTVCNVEAFSESNITWNVFYKIHVVLEVRNILVLFPVFFRSSSKHRHLITLWF